MNSQGRIVSGRSHHRPRTVQLLSVALLAWLGASAMDASAQHSSSRVYRCEGEDGAPLYQNAPGKGCRLLDLPPINSVPAAQLPTMQRESSSSSRNSARVSDTQQRGRDSDRRRILEAELAREKSRLAEIRTEYNDGTPDRRGDERNYQKYLDRVDSLKQQLTQSEQNVKSLQREIDSLR